MRILGIVVWKKIKEKIAKPSLMGNNSFIIIPSKPPQNAYTQNASKQNIHMRLVKKKVYCHEPAKLNDSSPCTGSTDAIKNVDKNAVIPTKKRPGLESIE